jgi:signal transduction histidine kinase
VASAAVYFQVRGAAVSSLAFTLVQAAMILPKGDITAVALALVPLGLFYLLFGVLLGYFCGRLRSLIDQAQEETQAARREVARAERERIRSLYKLISALGATLNYQRVMDTAMDIGYSTLAITDGGSEHMVSAVLLYSQDDANNPELKVGSARRFTAADMRIALPGKAGLIGRSIDQGTAQVSKGLAKDAELSRIVALRKCRESYCIPLRTGLDTYGVLLFAHPEEDFFTNERREILDIIGGQAIIALQNARLYMDLEKEKERIMEIQEEARKKLARDLHDGPTQSVAALAMRVNFARRLIEKDPKAAADELYKVEELARRTTKEIRHMLFTLRPLVLESQGLVAALQSMAEKMKDTYNQTVIIEADADTASQLEASKQGVIFYIAEEAVNNARKHAQAAHVWVQLKWAGTDLALLEIRDDGVGFDAATVDENYDTRGSLGMVNMRERAELVNGFLNIETRQGYGTRITLLIPLTEDASDRVRRRG